MNERRETMSDISTTTSAILGYRDETQKRPYAPPRVERLIGMSRDTGAKGVITPVEESPNSGPNTVGPS